MEPFKIFALFTWKWQTGSNSNFYDGFTIRLLAERYFSKPKMASTSWITTHPCNHTFAVQEFQRPWCSLDCKTDGFFAKSVKKSVKRAVRVLTSLPRSRSLFSASLQTFCQCLTSRAYLNTQKYGLFRSLGVHTTPAKFSTFVTSAWTNRKHR